MTLHSTFICVIQFILLLAELSGNCIFDDGTKKYVPGACMLYIGRAHV
jgi:hypothetical protein